MRKLMTGLIAGVQTFLVQAVNGQGEMIGQVVACADEIQDFTSNFLNARWGRDLEQADEVRVVDATTNELFMVLSRTSDPRTGKDLSVCHLGERQLGKLEHLASELAMQYRHRQELEAEHFTGDLYLGEEED